MVEVEPYWEKLRRLRAQAGLSQPALYRESGVSIGTIRGLERPYASQRDGATSSARYPSAETLERLAEALGEPPDVFDEYRLAKAREQLDERHSSLEEAVARLDQIIAALQLQAAQSSATTTKRQVERRHKLEAMPPGEETQEEDA